MSGQNNSAWARTHDRPSSADRTSGQMPARHLRFGCRLGSRRSEPEPPSGNVAHTAPSHKGEPYSHTHAKLLAVLSFDPTAFPQTQRQDTKPQSHAWRTPSLMLLRVGS